MPRPVSMSAVSMVGRFGEISRRLSEPCAASARPQIGPASTRVISITRMPSSGRVPARHSGFGASPIALDGNERQRRHRPAVRVRVPLREGAGLGDHQPGGCRGVLELLRGPALQRVADRLAVVGAVQKLQHAVAMVREVGVKPDPAAVAAAIGAGDLVPLLRRLGAVDPAIALAAKFQRGVAAIDGDALRGAAAAAMQFGRRKPRRGDAHLRHLADMERGRQGRIAARQ